MLDAGGGGCGSLEASHAFATRRQKEREKKLEPHAKRVTKVTLHICGFQREVKVKLPRYALSPSALLSFTGGAAGIRLL